MARSSPKIEPYILFTFSITDGVTLYHVTFVRAAKCKVGWNSGGAVQISHGAVTAIFGASSAHSFLSCHRFVMIYIGFLLLAGLPVCLALARGSRITTLTDLDVMNTGWKAVRRFGQSKS
jgi:hypothetical protein